MPLIWFDLYQRLDNYPGFPPAKRGYAKRWWLNQKGTYGECMIYAHLTSIESGYRCIQWFNKSSDTQIRKESERITLWNCKQPKQQPRPARANTSKPSSYWSSKVAFSHVWCPFPQVTRQLMQLKDETSLWFAKHGRWSLWPPDDLAVMIVI